MIADEVNAVVLDVGTYQAKAGYAGEDAPKFICPTAVGIGGETAGQKDTNAMEIDERTFRTGSNALETRRDGMEVISLFKDGLLYDWEGVEALWDHIFKYVFFFLPCAYTTFMLYHCIPCAMIFLFMVCIAGIKCGCQWRSTQ